MKRLAMVLSLILVFCVSMFAGAYADNMSEAALILHEPVSKKSETTEPVEPVVTLEMAKGGNVKLAFTTEGDSEWGKITKKQWATSDKTIATVSNGTINGKSAGEAIITLTLTYKNGQQLTANVPVTVYTPVKTLKIDQKTLSMTVGDAPVQLNVTVAPEDAKYQTVTWSTSDASVATVDENGFVTAVGGGKAKITATSNQPADSKGKTVSVSCTVTVTQLSGTVKLDHTTATLAKGSSMKLTATVLPAGTTNKKVEWTSSNPAIATVSNGKVTAKSVGTVTITATAKDGSGASGSCTFTIVQKATSVKLSESKRVVVFVGGTKRISATVSPADATNKKVTWSSSDTWVATVDSNGMITGRRAGTATITATAADGSGKKKSVTVVVEPLNPISLEKIGTGIFQPNLLGITVRNLTKTKTIKNFGFDMTLYSYNGSVINDGSFNLGDKGTSVGPGKTRTIKRTASGVGYSSKIVITITSVTFSDGTVYRIPKEEQKTWSFRIN